MRGFVVACWVLGVIAFVEIMAVGIAVAARSGNGGSPQVRIVEKIVEVPAVESAQEAKGPRSIEEILDDTPDVHVPIAPPQPKPESAEYADLYQERGLQVPPIADVLIERLVSEAGQLFIAGDAIRAVLKYEEVLSREPDQLHAVYGLAQIYEQMGRYDLATDYYARVLENGASAGVYYRRAARKIAEGFADELEMVDKMRIGQVRKNQVGQKVALTIPILSAPGVEIEPNDVSIKARIYVRDQQGSVRLLRDQDRSQRSNRWLSDEQDWATQEEVLSATFVRADSIDEPEFYGYVISLTYQNTVLDLVAWPRMLATRIQTQSAPPVEIPHFDDLPPDFFDGINLDNPILPVKPEI